MEKLPAIGRLFFATSLAAFGFLQFIFDDFVPGRAPAWPAGVPGQLAWAYGTGALFLAIGAAIAFDKKSREAAFVAVGLVFVWAFLRNIPVALADKIYGVGWTNLGKGLVLVGGALAVASLVRASPAFTWAGRVTLGAFMISSGIQHFLFVQFVKTLVPAWIPPGQEFWTYFAAVALIAGGVGLMVPWTTRLAAALSGLMIFLWVLLLHIPRALAAHDAAQVKNEWIAVFEALAFSGIAFVLTRTGGSARPGGAPPRR
jgi:uncharacterized membrane protein YphA (DoxX/SURF4 family)